jgi:superfamily I DNA and/or RNA helicase
MKIRAMLKEAETGHMKKKVEKISSTRVIGKSRTPPQNIGARVRLILGSVRTRAGVTCAASGFPILDGNVFPLVILDECSQMLEPHSMIPLARFGCERLVHTPSSFLINAHLLTCKPTRLR